MFLTEQYPQSSTLRAVPSEQYPQSSTTLTAHTLAHVLLACCHVSYSPAAFLTSLPSRSFLPLPREDARRPRKKPRLVPIIW